MTHPNDLFTVATRLDESPTEILNGGAVDALNALVASAQLAEALRPRAASRRRQ